MASLERKQENRRAKRPRGIWLLSWIALFIFLPRPSLADVVVLLPTKAIYQYDTALESFKGELIRLGVGPDQQKVLSVAPEPTTVSWINSVRRYATFDVKALVVFGGAATKAILPIKRSYPLLYCGVYNPVALGITGDNMAGTSFQAEVERLLVSMKKIANFSKLGIFYSAEEKDSELQAWAVGELKEKYAFKAMEYNIDKNPLNFATQGFDAIFMTTASAVNRDEAVKNIVSQARAAKIPTASLLSFAKDSGILLSLSSNPAMQGKEMAVMVVEALKGKDPAALADVKPLENELTINVREAKQLGMTVPAELRDKAILIE